MTSANIFSGHTKYDIKLRLSLYVYVFRCGEFITQHGLSCECSLSLSLCTAFKKRWKRRSSFMYCTARLRLTFTKTGNARMNVTLRRVHETIFSARSFTYFECLCVALGIQHSMRMPYAVICGLFGIFPYSLNNGMIFGYNLLTA
jgi:hypothetical protein